MREKISEVLPVMVGTAGHVDHGKTALVRLLTGCSTDTLKEEKERGLTIDLGFAPCPLSFDEQVGIVDVPGHIDFIKNMVAGATSIDVLMLVVAADDSIMPQTLEHLNIVRLLRNVELMCVITKSDLVDENRLNEVKADVEGLLSTCGYAHAPIVPVSNVTLEGLSNVRNTLLECVKNVLANRVKADYMRPFRMHVERVFSLQGHGTVITGIPLCGEESLGANIELLPSQQCGKIRTVQNFKKNSQCVIAHTCNAINLSQVNSSLVKRGMTLIQEGAYRTTQSMIAQITYIGEKPFKEKSQVRFHAGTASVLASIRSLFGDEIQPNTKALVKIRMMDELVLTASDPFLIRQLSPSQTLGGGVIISTQDVRLRQKDPIHLLRLEQSTVFALEHQGELAEMQLTHSPFFDLHSLAQISGVTVAHLMQYPHVFSLGGGMAFNLNRKGEFLDILVKNLTLFHQEKPFISGLDDVKLASIAHIPITCVKKLIPFLLEHFSHLIKWKNARLSLIDFEIQISARQMRQKEQVLAFLKTSQTLIPAIGTLLETLKIASSELQFVMRILIENQEVVQIGNHVFEMSLLKKCIEKISQLENPIQISAVKDSTQLSRNMSVAFLEYLDSKGLTRRQGEQRYWIAQKEKI